MDNNGKKPSYLESIDRVKQEIRDGTFAGFSLEADKLADEIVAESGKPTAEFTAPKPKKVYEIAPIVARKKQKIFTYAMTTLAAALVITLGLVFLIPILTYTPDTIPNRVYSSDRIAIESSLGELNRSLAGRMQVVFAAGTDTRVELTYDSHYNSNLFFEIEFWNVTANMVGEVRIYVNPLVVPSEREFFQPVESTVGQFAVIYTRIITHNLLYTISYEARLLYRDITIYIEYEEVSPTQDSNFFDFILQTFTIA
jgi:hypothetical protein